MYYKHRWKIISSQLVIHKRLLGTQVGQVSSVIILRSVIAHGECLSYQISLLVTIIFILTILKIYIYIYLGANAFLSSASSNSLIEVLNDTCFSWKAQSIPASYLFFSLMCFFPAIPSSTAPFSFWDFYLNRTLGSYISVIVCLKTREVW